MPKTNPEESNYARFMRLVEEFADILGIREDMEVQHHVELLKHVIEQRELGLRSGIVRRSQDPRRRFISIFLIQYAGPPADLKNFLPAFRAVAAELCAAK